MDFFVNNVERVEKKLFLKKSLKRIKINKWFAEDNLKKLIKMIPASYNQETILKFEKETGIKLKYYIFYEDYSFYEYTKLGIYPDNNAWITLPDGRKMVDLKANFMDDYDILVIDKKGYRS